MIDFLDDAYRRSVEDVAAVLKTDLHSGLTEDEAASRLATVGRNELTAEPPVPAWRRFLAQFTDVLVILLLVATAVSAALWFYERETALPYDSIAILAVVIVNATMGFIQESRAEAAVAALRAMSAKEASVVRDGERRKVPAAEVVPGDVIVIEQGDTIPADARVVHSTALMTAEATLTGESLPVSKSSAVIDEDVQIGDRDNMIFSQTDATYGRGTAVVTGTGMHTETGNIAGMLKDAPVEETPLQK
jgi:Ca2+-transporting ATPase